MSGQFDHITISSDSYDKLETIAKKHGFKNRAGNPSRSQAVEYLIKNFEAPIA